MKPVPAVIDIALLERSKIDPLPMVRVLTLPPVPHVPEAAEKVTLAPSAKVIFPTLPVPPPVNV
jgi:hypothetical protein